MCSRYPVGVALSTTAANLLKKDDAGNTHPHPMPILMMLSGDGLLCSFHAVHDTAAKVTGPPAGAPGQPRPAKIAIQAAPVAATAKSQPPPPGMFFYVRPIHYSQ